MSNVRRVYVEKKPDFAVKAKELKHEIKHYLGITTVEAVRVLIRYDVENISEETYKKALYTVFSEPPVDDIYEETFDYGDARAFTVEFLPGQFDQRADSAEQCVKLLNENEEPIIRSAITYVIEGAITDEQFAAIKKHCINPVDSRAIGMEKPKTLVQEFDDPADVIIFDGFKDMAEDKLKELYLSLNLAMTFKDFLHIQNYFKNEEKRDPSMTEIRVLDTYWSDHCRHTTCLLYTSPSPRDQRGSRIAPPRHVAAPPKGSISVGWLCVSFLKFTSHSSVFPSTSTGTTIEHALISSDSS